MPSSPLRRTWGMQHRRRPPGSHLSELSEASTGERRHGTAWRCSARRRPVCVRMGGTYRRRFGAMTKGLAPGVFVPSFAPGAGSAFGSTEA